MQTNGADRSQQAAQDGHDQSPGNGQRAEHHNETQLSPCQSQVLGIDGRPFAQAEPRSLYPKAGCLVCYQELLEAMSARSGVTLLTGPPGTGKTSLARQLARANASGLRFQTVCASKLADNDWLAGLDDALAPEFAADRTLSGEQGLAALVNTVKASAASESRVLIIDEADHLPGPTLEGLLELQRQCGNDALQVLLVGSDEILARVQANIGEGKTPVHAKLAALSLEQVVDFIDWHLEPSGRKAQELFSASAVGRIFLHSRGIPRSVNTLCDAVLMAATLEQTTQVSVALVDQAAVGLMLQTPAFDADPEQTVITPVLRQSDLDFTKRPRNPPETPPTETLVAPPVRHPEPRATTSASSDKRVTMANPVFTLPPPAGVKPD